MLRRHSIFWKLAALLITFCLLIVSLNGAWVQQIELRTSYLSLEARQTLIGYAQRAEQAVGLGPQAVDDFLTKLRAQERGAIAVLDKRLQPLGTLPVDSALYSRLTALRRLEWPMSRRSGSLPLINLPFENEVQKGSLVIQLPERFLPWRYRELLLSLVQYGAPVLLGLIFCVGLYYVLIAPLALLREQVNALRADCLSLPLSPRLARRKDELGELGRAFEHMARRLESSINQQRQLLRDLSHELRTPLSRLQMACETPMEPAEWRQRGEREVQLMRILVNTTLELAWLDTERPDPPLEPVDLNALWDVLREDAGFENTWPLARLPSHLPEGCQVLGHLNGLARALENILRNAIRHSPSQGHVWLDGQCEGETWLFWVQDQGPGVADSDLEVIFQPFTRLCADRPGGDGFGLGLAIARRMIEQQGGQLWAENRNPGLRLYIRLKMYSL